MEKETYITRSILLAVWRGDRYGRTVLTEETLAGWPPQGYLWRKAVGKHSTHGPQSETEDENKNSSNKKQS